MGFRPTVSNSRPSPSGPAKLLSAHTMKKHRDDTGRDRVEPGQQGAEVECHPVVHKRLADESARPRTARRGYFEKATLPISRNGIDLRWRIVSEPSGSDSVWSVSCSTSCSMPPTIRSASPSCP
jgi:hypothetical protein